VGQRSVRLRGRRFDAAFDARTGTLVGLRHRAHVPGLNFVSTNPVLSPELGFGRVRVRCRAVGRRKWEAVESGGAVTVLRSGGKAAGISTRSAGGPVRVASRFRLMAGEGLRWQVSVRNATDGPLEVGEVSFPLPFNACFDARDMRAMYEERVTVHPFVAGHGSYVLVQALCGRAPFLVVMPEGDTPLEAMARDQSDALELARFLGGGVLRVYAHSAASRAVLGWHEWFNGHTKFRLGPGERRVFSFALRWVGSYAELDEVLVRHGVGALTVIPAPVVPANATARVAVRSRRAVRRVRCPGARVRALGGQRYAVRFATPGTYTARVEFDDGRWTAVHFRAIEPVEALIRKRAAFIARKQQVTDADDPRSGAFLMWDCEDEALVREARAAFYVGGSDDLGFADPLYLAAKNAALPDEKERRALARYVEQFLHGKLQRPDDFGVVLWYGDAVWRHYKGSDVCRSFNYPHVFNLYHALYRAAKEFGPDGGLGARELLVRAWRTAMAMYTHDMIAGDAVTMGNMGQSALLGLLGSLDEEGLTKERAALRRQMRRSARHYARVRYPYGSEFSFDTTGYETVYFFRKAVGKDEALAAETLAVALATRHHAPAWYLAGNDVRSGFGNGKSHPLEDEIEFSYMASLNGLVVQDAYEATGDEALLRSAYASALGVWSVVRGDGAGRYLYTWEPARMLFDPWSSETGLALFGALEQQRAYVVENADFGLVGYGCEVRRVRGGVEVVPLDGLRRHVVWRARGLRVRASGATIERLVFLDEGGIRAELRGVTKGAHEARLRVERAAGRRRTVAEAAVTVRPRRSVQVEVRSAGA